MQRDDDREEIVRRRLVVYHKNTEKLIAHYRNKGLLCEASGEGTIEQVYQGVMKALKAQAGRS